MGHAIHRLGTAAAAAPLAVVSLLAGAAGAITLDEVRWETIALGDAGATVRFEAHFVNDNEVDSDPVTGELNPQPFGAFVGNAKGFICEFNVPVLPPGGEHTVICEIPFVDLPPSAVRLLPWEKAVVPGGPEIPHRGGCPIDDFWAGGVEASWIGDGDGLVVVHRGTLQVCPNEGTSYISVLVGCEEGAEWQFPELCGGFDGGLVNADFEPAPHPLPPGPWDGWICLEGDPKLPPGEICEFEVGMTCGSKSATIHMTSESCACFGQTAVEPSTWGAIKERFQQ